MTAPARIVHPALGFCVSLWHNGGNGREPSAPGKGRGITLKIAIVDDDAAIRGQLQAGIEEQLGRTVQFSGFPDGETFLAAWRPGAFDLVILDIFMGALTGMDVAEKLRETDRDVRIVFCTTSNEYASESYAVNACYYLRKPNEKDGIRIMLDRVDLGGLERLRTVRLPDGSSVILRDIVFADCAAHCVTLHGRHGDTRTVRAAFAQIEALLCAYPYFLSPSKGLIVDLYEVASQNAGSFTMSDGTIVPISRRKAKEVTDAYSTFLFSRLRSGGDA